MRRLFAVTAMLLLCVACAGGDKSQSKGQPDYLERVQEIMTELNEQELELGCEGSVFGDGPECDHRALREAFAKHNAALGSLQPPPEIAAQHNRLVDVFDSVANVVAAPTEELVDAVADNPDFARFQQRWNDWRSAVAGHYGLLIFSMEGASMEPALSSGEFVLPERYEGQPIQRFDIIVWEFHLDPERDFLKRVIGLPGETVEIRQGGAIFIDGNALGDPYPLEPASYSYGPEKVPAGHYFVLGDNRNNSYDSHAFGAACVPEDDCDFVPAATIIAVLEAGGTSLP